MYKVLNNIRLSKNFSLEEFICKDGKNEVVIAEGLIEKLQELRDSLGKPITIVSAYRSVSYNKEVGGSPKSQHLYGKAVDIQVAGINSKKVGDKAIELGFKGVGIYDTFTHVDIRDHSSNQSSRSYAYWDNRTHY